MFCTSCGKEFNGDLRFCTNCGKPVGRKADENSIATSSSLKEGWWAKRKKIMIWGGVFIVIGLIVAAANSNTNNQTPAVDNTSVNTTNQIEKPIDNSQSVVDIACDNGKGGSGTIFVKDGTVLTNNHVIAGSTSCIITLPDTTTGAPTEIYNASPIIVPVLSKKYDIAMLSIDSAYTDASGTIYGDYPTTFPAFVNPSGCTSTASRLGDSVRIYGYPVTSYDYNLTITDGIISNFQDDGTILTSAKIDSGNSGGLAVDQYGCFTSIPSAVLQGNYQNLRSHHTTKHCCGIFQPNPISIKPCFALAVVRNWKRE